MSSRQTKTYLDPTSPLEARVAEILGLMSDEQKFKSLCGIPEMRLSDGTVIPGISMHGVEGVHAVGFAEEATLFPQSIGLGMTWDPELIEAVGHVVAIEAIEIEPTQPRVWGPVLDLRHNPLSGRFEEGFGEDPCLVESVGEAYARGIIGYHPQYVLAKPEAKHFFGYNHEWHRALTNSSMSCRAAHEYHLRPFRKLIRSGALLGVMTAFNLVNGIPSIVHPMLRTAREDWAPGLLSFVPDGVDIMNVHRGKGVPYDQFERPQEIFVPYGQGFASEDTDEFTALATTVALLLKTGLSCFHDGSELDPEKLARHAVEQGLCGLSMHNIDRVVAEWLSFMILSGTLDDGVERRNVVRDAVNPAIAEQREQLALQCAREQFVLLKNDGILPLDRRAASKVALMGPLAVENLRDYYSSKAPDAKRSTPFDGISAALADHGEVCYVSGQDVVAWRSRYTGGLVTVGEDDYLYTESGLSSATGEMEFRASDGTPVSSEQAFEVYDWGYGQHSFKNIGTGRFIEADAVIGRFVESNDRSIDSSKYLRVNRDRVEDSNSWFPRQTFHVPERKEGGLTALYKVHYIAEREQFEAGGYVEARLEEGGRLSATMEYGRFHGDAADERSRAQFEEQLLKPGLEEAVDISRRSDYTIVVVGNSVLINGRETFDRPGLEVPPRQRELVHAAAAANPGRTIVVIVSSYPYAVRDFEENSDIAAILYSSHAGQATGAALAEVLFGDYSPAGRLTATWLEDESSLPRVAIDNGYGPINGVDMLQYDIETAGLTYRHSDARPVYPFGHGLTYSDFRYRETLIPAEIFEGESFEVAVELENRGTRASDEVVQVYASARTSAYGDRAPKQQLIGFKRVKDVLPGEVRAVAITIDPEQLAVWDTNGQKMIVESGEYELSVGASSADPAISQRVHVRGSEILPLDLNTTRNAWAYASASQGVSYWELSKAHLFNREEAWHSVVSRYPGSSIGFTRVRFEGQNRVILRVATTEAPWATNTAPAISLRLNSPDGPTVGRVTFDATGDRTEYIQASGTLDPVSGVHNLYLVFEASGIYLDSLRFTSQESKPGSGSQRA